MRLFQSLSEGFFSDANAGHHDRVPQHDEPPWSGARWGPKMDDVNCDVSSIRSRVFNASTVRRKPVLSTSFLASWPIGIDPDMKKPCPKDWQLSAAGCIAPPEYKGFCSPLVDFSVMDQDSKARFAAMCDIYWSKL
ncbi:unnamed protein product [Amoebophrya sp. A120]|nr:unnamed protein product [Amoebophrya sp. A120]|eukprot:GSA120T00023355001.1